MLTVVRGKHSGTGCQRLLDSGPSRTLSTTGTNENPRAPGGEMGAGNRTYHVDVIWVQSRGRI